jgi:hypothetical protein
VFIFFLEGLLARQETGASPHKSEASPWAILPIFKARATVILKSVREKRAMRKSAKSVIGPRARKSNEAGVDMTAVRCGGLIHAYGPLNALSEMPAVRDALHQAAEMLRKHRQ